MSRKGPWFGVPDPHDDDAPSEHGGRRGLFHGGAPRTASEGYMAERQAIKKEEERAARKRREP